MSKKIDKLTAAQEKVAKEYIARYNEIAGTTGRCDRTKALKAFQEFYDYKKYGNIKGTVWFDNPIDAAYFVARGIKARKGIDPTDPASRKEIEAIDVTKEEVREVLQKACYGSLEAYWVCFYVFCREELKTEDHPLIDICDNIAKETGIAWFCQDYVIASDRPKVLTRNGVEFESKGDAPAVVYYDGFEVYAKGGKRYRSLMEMRLAEKGLL